MALGHSSISTIPFNRPAGTGRELAFLQQVLSGAELTDGHFIHSCQQWLQRNLGVSPVYLTPSCTHALEMAALLLDIRPGDEIIMPSYTFASAANAFSLRGGVPVFVDIRPDTMNIDEDLIEQAVTTKTRAIMIMHYAGVACEMEKIIAIGLRHNLPVIEDAAQALMAKWKDKHLGTLGMMGTYSFHQTKNFTGGEGGAIVINDPSFVDRAEIVRHKGTDRTRFIQGKTPQYTWVDLGSSWGMNELNAAYLYGNLLHADDILNTRHAIWSFYRESLAPLDPEHISLPFVPTNCQHNAHIFYLKVSDRQTRMDFLSFMKEQGIMALFHYVPLHSSPAGLKYGRFCGKDQYTTRESERLVRLPLFYNMEMEQAQRVVEAVHRYYGR